VHSRAVSLFGLEPIEIRPVALTMRRRGNEAGPGDDHHRKSCSRTEYFHMNCRQCRILRIADVRDAGFLFSETMQFIGDNHDRCGRKKNRRKSAKGCARREVTEHAGGRVCARRDASCERRKARCAFAAAGDRDRAFEGAARRVEIASAETRQREGEAAGSARYPKRTTPVRRASFAETVAGSERCGAA